LIVGGAAVAPLRGEDQPQPFPDMAPHIAKLLADPERGYYDKSRIAPKVMVERAVRALENAEIQIDCQWVDNAILVTAPGYAQPQRVAATPPQDLAQAMDLIEGVRGVIDGCSLPADRRRNLSYALLTGALLSLDPHTYIDPPEPAKEILEGLAGEFYGIGAYLSQDEGVISIERVMPGLPAERAGIEDGDIILAVDGEKTAGLALDQAVHRIKGPKGSTVHLTLERKGAAQPITIPVVRDLVQIIKTRAHRAGEVGYVRVDEFNANTARDLQAAIQGLVKVGPIKAFVLDLRYNPGGILDQAVAVSDLFLPKDREVVRTVTSDGRPDIQQSSARQILDVPMVILVSGGSASAAEIVSGGLQRNDRAVVAGSATFGKGTVQNMRPLRDGSRLRMTIQEYQLPGGVSIQGHGVGPDLALVRRTVRKDGRIDVAPFTGSKEGDDEFAIANRSSWKVEAAYVLGWLSPWQTKDELKRSSIAAPEFKPDQESTLVIDMLAAAVAAPDWSEAAAAAARDGRWRPFLLDRLKVPVAERAERESRALGEALSKRPDKAGGPLPWGAAGTIPAGTISVSYTGPATLTAGQATTLPFTIVNHGNAPVGRLYGVVKADVRSPFWEDEVVIGEVAPGTELTRMLDAKVPARLFAGEERFSLEIHADGQREPLATVPVSLQIQGLPRPHFSYSWAIADQGVLRPNGSASIRLAIRNEGDGVSGATLVRVFKNDDVYLQLQENVFKFRSGLAPGGEEVAVVGVSIRDRVNQKDFSAKQVKLQLRVQEDFSLGQPEDSDDDVDNRMRSGLFSTIIIPVGEPASGDVRQPRLTLVTAEAESEGRVLLTVHLSDDNPRCIATFVDEDKIDLRPVLAADLKDGVFIYQKRVTLKPGPNAVRIEAQDQGDVGTVLPLRLWGPAAVDAPKASASAAPATGAVP
jgi:carboxyl-terminal processing protease